MLSYFKRLFNKSLFVFIFAFIVVITGSAVKSYAESDATIHVYIYHDYYVPYMPGADNCYGVYRIVGSRGYQNIAELAVSRTTQAGKLPGSDSITIPEGTDYVGQYQDTRSLYRDDVFVFTSFQITAGPFEEIITSGRYIYHHIKTYYFEAPYAVVGYMADFSPVSGSSAYTTTGRPWLIAADLNTILTYMPTYDATLTTPNYPGSSSLASVSYASWKTLESGNVTSNDWAYISKSTNSGTSGRRYYGRASQRYSYILTANPTNDRVKDIVGWWSPWAYEILQTVDDIRKNGEIDEKQSYDEFEIKLTATDIASGITTIPSALLTAMEWDTVSIYYDESTIDGYMYGTPLTNTPSLGSTSQVWRYTGVPTLDNINTAYQEVSNSIIEAAQDGESVEMPWTAGSGALDALQGSVVGFFHAPKAVSLENKSMSLVTFDPEFIGQYPFHRAQYSLYSSGDRSTPTLGGYTDSLKSMSAFLGTTVTESTNYLSAFTRKISSSPFKYGLSISTSNSYEYTSNDIWNDPYMPGDTDISDIWYWWRNNYRDFYDEIVPLMAVGSGMTLFDVSGATGWSRGIQRKRYPQIILDKDVNLNTTKTFSTSTQTELKSRDLSDISTYTTVSGEVMTNNVSYISDYKDTDTVDYGSVTIKGNHSFVCVSPMSVRYYPGNYNALSSIKQAFPFLGTSIALPDMTTHQTLWETFDTEMSSAGINSDVSVFEEL